MNLPPDDAVCIEAGCRRPAQALRPLGVTEGGDVVVEWVCDDHASEGATL